jgi:hypothetical protein
MRKTRPCERSSGRQQRAIEFPAVAVVALLDAREVPRGTVVMVECFVPIGPSRSGGVRGPAVGIAVNPTGPKKAGPTALVAR